MTALRQRHSGLETKPLGPDATFFELGVGHRQRPFGELSPVNSSPTFNVTSNFFALATAQLRATGRRGSAVLDAGKLIKT